MCVLLSVRTKGVEEEEWKHQKYTIKKLIKEMKCDSCNQIFSLCVHPLSMFKVPGCSIGAFKLSFPV